MCRKQLFTLLILHFIVLLFQASLRQLFFDTVFYRDMGIFVLFLMYITTSSNTSTNDKSSISKWIKGYIIYGVIIIFLHSVNGFSLLESVVQFRNHFFPFVLFFVSYLIFRENQYRKKWIDFIFVLFLIMLFDIYLEYTLGYVGLSKSILPWCQYVAAHSEYIETSDRIYSIDEVPVIGLLGWHNPSACAFTALFCMLMPFLLNTKSMSNEAPMVMRLSTFKKVILCILSLGAIVFLETKTPIVSLILAFIVYTRFSKNNNFKMYLSIAVILVIVAFLTVDLWSSIVTENIEEVSGDESSFLYLFSMDTIGGLFSALFDDSILSVFTGGDFTNNYWYNFIEVRLVSFTLCFGLIWLFIIIGIFMSTINVSMYVKKRIANLDEIDQLLMIGSVLLLINYAIDMLHYIHVMYFFHLDLVAATFSIICIMYNKIYNHE